MPPSERDDSLVNRVLRTRESIFVEDARQDAFYDRHFEAFGVRSGAVMPLVSRTQIVGLLILGYVAPHSFDALSTALLESVARQLAVAIDNARLTPPGGSAARGGEYPVHPESRRSAPIAA